MSEKKNEYAELEEKSLKILQFVETLVDENADGYAKSGDVMSLLGGTIHMFFKQCYEQLGAKRATEIKSAMMLLLKIPHWIQR